MMVASRYAKSFMDLAIESNQLNVALKDMKLILKICEQNPDFILFLNSPLIKTDKKIDILKKLFENNISKLTLSFLNLITVKNRESLVNKIAISFNEQYKLKNNIFTVIVTSAFVLEAKTKNKILEMLQLQLKGEVELIEKIEPTLIGGFVLKIGDSQIDKSLARQLNDLKKELINN